MKTTTFIFVLFAAMAAGCGSATKKHSDTGQSVESRVSEAQRRESYSIESFDYGSIWVKWIERYREFEDEDILYQGIIGDGYRRIQMKFLTVEPSDQTPGLYNVTGKSNVNDNICNFEGYFQVDQVKTYDGDLDCPEAHGGSVHGTYKLWESKEEKDSGLFEGRFLTLFDVVEHEGQTLLNMSQGYYICEGLNDFIGTWTSYKTGKSKICNWGWRIPPDAPDLFRHRESETYICNHKYLDRGWESYVYGSGLFVFADFDTGEEVKEEAGTLEEKQNKYRQIERRKWWL